MLDRKKIEVRHNSEWLAEMTAADILRLLARATLQQVLQREDFADRLKSGAPIGAHEVLYPFNQAYDSVAVQADLEIGGTDQLFNLLFGREIQKAYGQEPQDIAVFPLLEGTDGSQKMSKSLGNYIGINEPPEQIYGKTMSIPDTLIEKYARLISGFEPQQQAEVHAMKPRDAKAALARQLVKRLHGEEAAHRAEEDFDRRFRRRELPIEVTDTHLPSPQRRDIVSVLIDTHRASSGREARRLVEQGGVRVEGKKVGLEFVFSSGGILQVGKSLPIRVQVR